MFLVLKKTIFFLLIIYLITACTVIKDDTSYDFQNEVKMLNYKSDTLSIKHAIKEYNQGKFSEPINSQVFYPTKDLESTWLHFKIDSLTTNKYFTIWNSYLKYGKVFIVANNTIDTLNNHKRYRPLEQRPTHFRLPTWKIEKNNATTNVFIKLNDSDRYNSSFKLLLLNSNDFIKYTQADKNYNVIISTFLIILGFIVIILFALQKQFNMLWYIGYIIFLITDFLIFKGIWFNNILFENPFLLSNFKTITQASSIFFLARFLYEFYPFPKEKSYAKLFLRISFYINSIVFIFFAYKFLIGDFQFNLYWVWMPIRLSVVLIIIAHFILIFKKTIPLYLGFSFLLSMIFALVHLTLNPDTKMTLQRIFFLENLSYIIGVFETTLITYYMIREAIKEKMLAINLREENLKLRNNFESNILKVQHQERNNLVNNVHDSFGGYLEALKLRLLQTKENTPEQVHELLKSFDKEYRYLLNSLYAPKINSENFIESLIEFCEKLNSLTKDAIQYSFSLEKTFLTQEHCIHLYRIISELTTNALKYAKASEIKISINQNKNETIILNVSDNGIGFDTNEIPTKGFGLKSIKSRVTQMNGDLEIDSSKNIGSTITIKIPKTE